MKIATAGSRTSRRWKTIDVSWDWLLERLRTPKRTGETMREYRSMSRDEQSARKDVGGFVGGALSGGRRTAAAVTERWLVTLDADAASPGDWDNFTALWDCRACLYSTHSHTPEAPRLRWVIPLRRAVTPEEYPAVARKVAEWIDIEQMDPTTYQPERLMYWPSCPEDGEYVFREQDGPILDPDSVLAEYGAGGAWRDASLWPISEKETTVVLREARRQGDPETKPGIVGKFCRAFDIDAAIERFLPGVYIPCELPSGQPRYTYAAGSSSGGAVVYEDGKFLYSHHATDPAGGMLCNAFDLVRVHKFGELDADCQQQEITRRPSYQAMCAFVTGDEACRRAFLAEHLAEADADFADMGEVAGRDKPDAAQAGTPEQTAAGKQADTAARTHAPAQEQEQTPDDTWLAELGVNRKTGEADSTITNAALILRNDPRLRGAFAINQFSMRPVVRRDLPWRRAKDGDLWEDADDANLLLYMEQTWRLVGENKIRNAWTVVANENAYHPVREYLDGLCWDGTERLDTLLVRYMGAEDTPYTRAVTRKWMTAAVKRMYQPGCKFDAMLVLVGAQGIGKSRLAAILSRGWFTDSLTCMDGKEAYEAIRGSWIIEVAELAAARRSEQEAQKKFISSQVDTYRPAYGRNVVSLPRQCVFYGSTNDMEPLKDDTGARRYWPVLCAGANHGQHIGLEEEVDQLWAEAVMRYCEGETLWLDDRAVAEEAQATQEMMTVQDELSGQIEEYLDIPLPFNWEDRKPEERRAYIQGDTLDDHACMTCKRTRVCVVEIRVELLGEMRATFNNDGISRRIAAAMSRMPGWTKGKQRRRVRGYGPQWVYYRDGYETPEEDETNEMSTTGGQNLT